MEKPLIFLTNDDGVNAKGLEASIEVARKFGRVLVVAPENSQSGMSHAITMSSPLFLRKVKEEEGLIVYACSGTPVDCVKMAFDTIMQETPALAISGINHGSNSAISVIYSGTMGAAIECSFYNVPSIGLSLLNHEDDADFSVAKEYAKRIIERVMTEEIDVPLCLNVNIPDLSLSEIKGISICRQNKGYWREEFLERKDPRDRSYYWLTGLFLNQEENSPGTDEYALGHGYVSIVPIQIDMTNYSQMDMMSRWNF